MLNIEMMKSLSFALFSLSLSLVAIADSNWSTQRGPHSDGTGEEGMELPTKFSPTENVVWKADLPGGSAATPIVWGDHVFVTAADHE